MAHTTTNPRQSGAPSKPREDYYDYVVRDPEGRKIGRVKELFASLRGEPQYVRVRVGFFGLRSVLIPVCFVAIDEERRALTLL
jgi:hypothetical protein